MSDCFDHALDAFESMHSDQGYDHMCYEGGPGPWHSSWRQGSSFKYDPDFYHVRVSFSEVKAKTDKAYLLVLSNGLEVWVPKSICRRMSEQKQRVWIHGKIFREILKTRRDCHE